MGWGFRLKFLMWVWYFSKEYKIVNFKLKNIDLGAKSGNKYKYGPKNHAFRFIEMGHISEASAAHPY